GMSDHTLQDNESSAGTSGKPATAEPNLNSTTTGERPRIGVRALNVPSLAKAVQFWAAFLPGLAALFAILQLGSQAMDRSLQIEPISVPKSLNESGYTPDVIALKLNDAIKSTIERAATRMKLEATQVTSGETITPAATGSFAA